MGTFKYKGHTIVSCCKHFAFVCATCAYVMLSQCTISVQSSFSLFCFFHIATNIFSLAAMSQPLCVVNLKCICAVPIAFRMYYQFFFFFDAIQNLLNRSFNRKQHLYLRLLHKRYWMVPSRDIFSLQVPPLLLS